MLLVSSSLCIASGFTLSQNDDIKIQFVSSSILDSNYLDYIIQQVVSQGVEEEQQQQQKQADQVQEVIDQQEEEEKDLDNKEDDNGKQDEDDNGKQDEDDNGKQDEDDNGKQDEDDNGKQQFPQQAQQEVEQQDQIQLPISETGLNLTGSANNPPTAIDNPKIIITQKDKSVEVTLAGSDIDQGDDLTAEIDKIPLNGQLSVINQTTGNVTYTPNPNFVGEDVFTFKVKDKQGQYSNNVGTVRISVQQQLPNQPPPPNNPPTAIDNPKIIITQKDKSVEVTLAGSDIDQGDDLTAEIDKIPLNGQLSVINQTTGNVTYTPNPNFVGEDVFTFKVKDKQGQYSNNVGTVRISVQQQLPNQPPPPNNSPTAIDVILVTTQNKFFSPN
jgi:hypothetical protein